MLSLTSAQANYRLFWELIFLPVGADTHAAARNETLVARSMPAQIGGTALSASALILQPSGMFMIGLTPRKIDFGTLCATVERRLCELGHLEPHQFPMTQRELVRGGKKIGVYFCVHGPRSVKLTAICDFFKNTVIFYGSDGIRRECMSIVIREPVAV